MDIFDSQVPQTWMSIRSSCHVPAVIWLCYIYTAVCSWCLRVFWGVFLIKNCCVMSTKADIGKFHLKTYIVSVAEWFCLLSDLACNVVWHLDYWAALSSIASRQVATAQMCVLVSSPRKRLCVHSMAYSWAEFVFSAIWPGWFGRRISLWC